VGGLRPLGERVNDAEARQRVFELAPELCDAPLARATMGAEREVWFVGDDHVLRLASLASSLTRIQFERCLLARLEGALPVRTPVVIAVSADESCDICRKAPGDPMDWRAWMRLTRLEKHRVCGPMGRLAAALHDALPAEEASMMGIPAYEVPEPESLRSALAGSLRTPAQQQLLDAVSEEMPSLANAGGASVVLHNDLSHHNIGFDPGSPDITGVFDFAGAAVGDPHRDLRYDPALEYGGDSMLRAYEEARGVSMSRARQRGWHALSALENLRWSLGHEGAELQAVRWGWVDAVAAWDLRTLTA
jgi:aminoglycoside phosphotransferase (APT) family kinase protein